LDMHVSVLIDTSLHLDDESPTEPSLSRSISMISLRNRTMSMNSGSHLGSPEIEVTPPLQTLPDGYHIFLPYFGGRDDQIALTFVLQLMHGSNVKATIVRIQCGVPTSGFMSPMSPMSPTSPVPVHLDTSKEARHSEGPAEHENGSSIVNAVSKMVRFSSSVDPEGEQPETFVDQTEDEHHVTHQLNAVPDEIKSRLTVERFITPTPLQYAVKRAKRNIDSNCQKNHLIIVGRGVKSPRDEATTALLRHDLRRAHSSEMIGRSCLGEVGEAMFLGYVTGGLLVVQSGKDDDE